ncbi:hypothetical protein FKM82_025750 [Ascaphus truei]
MKAAVILLVLGAFLIHVDALQCHKNLCSVHIPCTKGTETCDSGLDHCILLMTDPPNAMLLQECVTKSNCLKMTKRFEHSSRCCTSDLCN